MICNWTLAAVIQSFSSQLLSYAATQPGSVHMLEPVFHAVVPRRENKQPSNLKLVDCGPYCMYCELTTTLVL